MINGAHLIIHSRNTEADRGFFRDVLELPNVDVGDGWLIFGLPPSVTLPGGGKLGIYQPRHGRPSNPGTPPAPKAGARVKKRARKPVRKMVAPKKPAAAHEKRGARG